MKVSIDKLLNKDKIAKTARKYAQEKVDKKDFSCCSPDVYESLLGKEPSEKEWEMFVTAYHETMDKAKDKYFGPDIDSFCEELNEFLNSRGATVWGTISLDIKDTEIAFDYSNEVEDEEFE